MDTLGKYRLIITLLLIWLSSTVFSQEPAETPLLQPDSARIPVFSQPVDFLSVPDPGISPALLNPIEWIEFQAPAFDINQYIRKNRIAESFAYEESVLPPAFGLPFSHYSLFSPFIHSGAVLHQAAYQLGEKFTVGGNSFGMNSIFSPLPMHPSANQWDVRGASMFMQYKVNKNFKIETRISVTGNQYHP